MFSILIVDDDKIIRMGLKKIIESNMEGFEVIGEAPNGVKALEVIKELRPDILITDIKMPVMNGIELINNINKLSLKIRSIVLSGFDDYKYIRETFKNGAVDYILKPISNDTLFELLTKIKSDIENERLEEERNNLYKSQIRQVNLMLKQEILSKLLKKGFHTDEYFKEEIKKLDIQENDHFYLGLVDEDKYFDWEEEGKYEGKNLDSLKNSVYNELNYYSEIETIICEIDDRIAVLVISHKDKSDNKLEKIMDLLEKLKGKVGKDIDKTISIGMSQCFYGLEDINKAYNQVKLAMENRFYCGGNSIYIYKNENDYANEIDSNNLETLINSLINGIELCSKEKVAMYAEKILNFIYKERLKPIRFRTLLSDIILRIANSNKDFKSLVTSKEKGFDFYISKLDTYLQVKRYFISELQHYVDEMSKMRCERGMKIIEKAKEFINKNYRKEITLKDVADYVYLNPNYFSELFKNEVGENFIEYLIETRINASKELLKSGSLKVYEIAEAVGYKEAVSFSRAFKKVVGVSPKEYVQLIN
ncbi:response regulator transcription factor [Clostridium hydrogenum]|uniref:response regulator transcription factor n=1 Tax=Clostridium hydrogenum TaxID=2855764 RepID=UPI001F2E1AF6|nr:response regulator [Clostridium hydrogenum]